jgi:putative transposase
MEPAKSSTGSTFAQRSSQNDSCAQSFMARHPRIAPPGITQHVVQRGTNRCDTFRHASDYQLYLLLLARAAPRFDVTVHAYALMSNHVHLMMTPQRPGGLPGAMHFVSGLYAQIFNHRYGRTGALWEGRYRSSVVADDRYWLTCMQYVELNPVRAGIVRRPEDYRWSSYRCHALGTRDAIVEPHALVLGLGVTAAKRQCAWRAMCETAILTPFDQP